MDKIKVFQSQYPGAYYFDGDNLKHLPDYLASRDLITFEDDIQSIEKPGEGNMNFVRRIITSRESLILKQGRPWVEKYPQLEAPVERLEVEYTYYSFLSHHSFFSTYAPKIILYDPANLILVMQDLGRGSDFTHCYQKSNLPSLDHLRSLLDYLIHLHHIDWGTKKADFPSNQALKKLNHEHIFLYPFMKDNGFDLDTIQPGLQKLSMDTKENEPLKRRISLLGEKYLSSGPVLIHGDYYPGSWLQIDEQVKVIDPEFAFFGFAEFDLGVMTAHLFIAGMDVLEIKEQLSHYNKRADFDEHLFYGFCGTELLRRIIGLAQLPLQLDLTEKKQLIEMAESFIFVPEEHMLI